MSIVWAIVPYKEPPFGKSRLSNRLTAAQRTTLASTMLEEVVDALSNSTQISGILLVSDSIHLDEFSHRKNVIVLETQTDNLRDAVTQAALFATNQLNCSTSFIVPADLPLISTEDIDCAIKQHEQVTLIPDVRFKGTNGVIATPPNAFEYVFNGQSFNDHQQNARSAGLRPKSLQIESFAHDVDTFDDLMMVVQLRPESRTSVVYRSLSTSDSSLLEHS